MFLRDHAPKRGDRSGGRPNEIKPLDIAGDASRRNASMALQ
jgi:hypothetical protein